MFWAAVAVVAIVFGISFGIVLALRWLMGADWTQRMGWGVQQFRGLRPVWHHDQHRDYAKAGAGTASLIGHTAEAATTFAPSDARWRGSVRIHGELWSAEASGPVEAREKARSSSGSRPCAVGRTEMNQYSAKLLFQFRRVEKGRSRKRVVCEERIVHVRRPVTESCPR